MKIGIVGLGLIGGSLGWDLREMGHKILGISRSEPTCQRAIELGVVDDASTQLNILAEAEVIFICTPLAALAPTICSLIPHLSPNAILTDVGSVKTPVVKAVAPLWHNFVGGHPMAGKAESGLEAACPNLFVGAPYVTTPVETTPQEAVNIVEEIARSLGANLISCSPEDHDRAVAWISHLPVMVSTGLIGSCISEPDATILKLAQQLASSGFRDTSRVGGGNPELGVMMARYNRSELLRSLHQYRHCLDRIILLIEQENWQELEQLIMLNQQARPEFIPESC